MIEVRSNVNIEEINNYYAILESFNGVIDIKLPKEFNNYDFSKTISFLQFMSTWIRSEKSGNIHLPVNKEKGTINDYFFDNEFVYPTIGLCWTKNIYDEDGDDIKSLLIQIIQEYYNKMEFFSLKNPSYLPIFCFDRDKRKSGFVSSLYDVNDKLYNEDSIGLNLYRGYKRVADSINPRVFKESIAPKLDDFNAIIFELFGNTHEHARTNEKGYNLYPNLRAIYLKLHRKKIEKFKEQYFKNSSLLEYFSSSFSLNNNDELYLLEVSIVDSGPGFYKRFTGKEDINEITLKEEIEIIKKCLYRNSTSTNQVNKGQGLDRVLQTIDKKGFVRIKSGRVDLFKNMKKENYKHHNNPSEIILYDFEKNNHSDFSEYPFAEGTLISIFYPIDYK